MFNILPEKEKKLILKEYRARLLVVTLTLVLFTGISALIFLVPMYVLSSQKERIAKSSVDFLKESLKVKDEKSLTDVADFTKAKILALNTDDGFLNVGDLIEGVSANRTVGIKITSVSLQEKPVGKKSVKEMIIGGKADNRNNLLNFQKTLESIDFVSDAKLPISNYAKETDISFNIVVTVKQDERI